MVTVVKEKRPEREAIFADLRDYVEKLGFPRGDLYELPTSRKRFRDGVHYRIEVPTVNTSEALRTLLQTAKDHGTVINRISMTYGIFRLTDKELIEFVELCKEHGCELFTGIGPRATYDTGAQIKMDTVWAHAPVYRLRGMEQVLRGIEDVRRATELGCRGIIVYDEGILYLLNRMRQDELIPRDTKFKASALLGYSNPVGFKILEQLGADSINGQRDLELPMIAALRAAVDVPIDIHVDNPVASGAFVRTYEGPEMVRIGSPIYIKTGNIVLPRHGYRELTERDSIEMARQAALSVQFIKKYFPPGTQSEPRSPDLAVPK